MAGSSEHVDGLQVEVAKTWERLNSIWLNFGYDDENMYRRQKAIVKHVSELLQEMLQEAEEKLSEQQQKLDTLMVEIMQLAKDLSIEQVPELAAASGKTLLDMEKIFLDIANGLRKRKAARMEKYNKINDKVIEISDELDETPMKIEFEGIPADSQVAKLEQTLTHLYHEKIRRFQRFNNFKKSIAELLELLERKHMGDFESVVFASDDEINPNHPISASGIKVLSLKILNQLEELEINFQEQVDANKYQGEKYWQKIRELWSRLSVDEEVMHAFLQVHRSVSTDSWKEVYKPSVLKGLHKELERLEEEKRKNMALFIKQVREELCDLWLSKCFMTSVEIRFTESNYFGITPFTISDFTSDLYTEDLLEKHENEVEFWREFAERNKKIIDGIIKRGQMFAQYRLLDQKSDDPSRLANRGGALLKEEKERKMLEKSIPKLENELKQLCEFFEQEAEIGRGMTKFMVYGRTINEMIEQDWEEFHEEKRLRKEAKKKPNDAGVTGNKTMMTTQLGNPGSRKRPATPSSTQRGAMTPIKRNKTQAMTPGKTMQSPFIHPSTVLSATSSVKRIPAGQNKATRVPKVNNPRNVGQYFRPNTSAAIRTASKKLLRKSFGKVRSASSLHSGTSAYSFSSSSNENEHKSSLSQPNLQLSSLEQLNFSEVIRGHGPPIIEEVEEKTPKKKSYDATNFAFPSSSRSAKKTPSKSGVLTRQASAGKIAGITKLSGKEQIPPQEKKYSKDAVISPVSSYSEFTDHLLCQSTLNSSAVVPVQSQNNRQILSNIPATSVPTTPTKSGMTGLSFTPAKLPLSDNCF